LVLKHQLKAQKKKFLTKIENSPTYKTITLDDGKEIKLQLSSQKFTSTIGMAIGIGVYFAWFFTIFFLIIGSILTRTILVLLLIYQFCFAKKNESYRRFLAYMKPWEYFKSYNVYTEVDLTPNNSIFSFHPHGVLGYGAAMSGALNNILYDAYFCGSRAMVRMPISGIIARWMGVQGVDQKNFKDLLKKGKNILFVPGGFEEATLTQFAKERIFIKERKGFIKYSLQYGYKIHPCYSFNENKIYYTFPYLEKLRLLLNKLKIPGVLFYSKYLFFPDSNIDLFVVVGKPIQFPQISEPTQEQIDFYHKMYVDSVCELYNRYKKQLGCADELEIL